MTGKTTANGKKVVTFKDPKQTLGPGAYQEIQIPCGQCTECRLRYRRGWAVRLIKEKESWRYAYFITLTYDDDHIHRVPTVDTKTGEVIEISTLYKPDMTKFLKRYRGTKRSSHDFGKVKYFQCGEYGENTYRRHHHIIIYQEKPIPDLKPYKINRNHQMMYTSETVEKIWGLGYAVIGEVTAESAGYVARYVMKKQKGEGAKIYDDLGIIPEYVTMSNGLGYEYFKKNKEAIYKYDSIIYTGMDGKAKTRKPPRRYDEMFADLDQIRLDEIKEQRLKAAIRTREIKGSQTTREDWQLVEQRALQAKQKLLKRGDI